MDTLPTRDQFIEEISSARAGHSLPPRAEQLAEEFTTGILALLFPHFASGDRAELDDVRGEISSLEQQFMRLMVGQGMSRERALEICHQFMGELPKLQRALQEDAEATYQADPAAVSVDEVLLAYPGFVAITYYRIAHRLHRLGVELLPRLITELAHRQTGIDIHPGATIGHSLAIDHGTGIVIGETSVIGDRVRLYQGVTIGALSVRKEFASQKRHPTIGDDVVVYANASLLGGDTVIGPGSVIGGNVWLTHAVPAGSVVTHGATVERQRLPEEPLLEYQI
jgi:serine O-acetyltransferase